jgi:predicted metal-dependent HD superfamily phosphohydrolase
MQKRINSVRTTLSVGNCDTGVIMKQTMNLQLFALAAKRYYQTGQRPYHNYEHACNVLGLCNKLLGDNQTVILAALFHDAVYLPGYIDNEKASAHALRNVANLLEIIGEHIDWEVIEKAELLIQCTTLFYHLSPNRIETQDIATILDADLGSLAISYDAFVEKQIDIIEENFGSRNSKEDRKKSADFLSQFLTCREYIYHTDCFRNCFEKDARNNIQRWIDENSVL